MKQVFAVIGAVVGAILLMMVLSLTFGWFNVGYTKTVGKAQQNEERTVFEETQSYVEGKRQFLNKEREEYRREKDPQAKEAIRQSILHEMANFDLNKLSNDDYSFVQELKNNFDQGHIQFKK
jgi:hypothetical protein